MKKLVGRRAVIIGAVVVVGLVFGRCFFINSGGNSEKAKEKKLSTPKVSQEIDYTYDREVLDWLESNKGEYYFTDGANGYDGYVEIKESTDADISIYDFNIWEYWEYVDEPVYEILSSDIDITIKESSYGHIRLDYPWTGYEDGRVVMRYYYISVEEGIMTIYRSWNLDEEPEFYCRAYKEF